MPAMLTQAMPVAHEKIEAEASATAHENIRSTDYMPITDTENVERFVRDYFADIPLLAEIARCESQFRQYHKGQVLQGNKNKYDRGVMQINILYHGETAKKMGLDVHNIDDNVAYARYLYEEQGSKPWKSSSKCWSKSAAAGAQLAAR